MASWKTVNRLRDEATELESEQKWEDAAEKRGQAAAESQKIVVTDQDWINYVADNYKKAAEDSLKAVEANRNSLKTKAADYHSQAGRAYEKAGEYERAGNGYEESGKLYSSMNDSIKAERAYRHAKINYKNFGDSHAVRETYYKERMFHTKNKLKSKNLSLAKKLYQVSIQVIYGFSCGWGVRILRWICLMIFFIVLFALFYSSGDYTIVDEGNFLNLIYYSAVTFTTLGYGDIFPTGNGKLIASVEALLGAFMMAGLVVIFFRKMEY